MRPNFARDVHCILGLPFDAIDTAGVERSIQESVRTRMRCFLSTPNLNFVIAARADAQFRDSVYRSDLSVADGMPLVWLARLLRIPIPERVAGSAVFERLRANEQLGIKVFFFGGPDGVAERACHRLNESSHGLRCVGFDSPGFGSVASMSEASRIEAISASGADLVVVSLGARKGQAWIEHVADRLRAPVISHLGAVVNFVAGTVRRAPKWMQRAGLEWTWRIKEEPRLWRRYASDATEFGKLLVTRIIPLALHVRWCRPCGAQFEQAAIVIEQSASMRVLRLSGAWERTNLGPVRVALTEAASDPKPLHIDCANVTYVDSALVALLGVMRVHCHQMRLPWSVGTPRTSVSKVFRYCCAEHLLQPLSPSDDLARG